jgi:hypothetical protein
LMCRFVVVRVHLSPHLQQRSEAIPTRQTLSRYDTFYREIGEASTRPDATPDKSAGVKIP